jgi:hypothetical protein
MGVFQNPHGKRSGNWKILALSAMAALAVAGISQTTHAALVASDNAGNYSSGQWSGTQAYDQGTGFQSWYLSQSGSGPSGLFLASPSNNAGGPNSIVPPPPSTSKNIWGVYANNGNNANNSGFIQIYRSFTNSTKTGVGKLDPGQTFSIALSSDGVSSLYAIGFNLQSTGETSQYLFQMIFAGGNADMQISDGSGSYTLSGVPFSAFGTSSVDQGGIVANVTIGSAVAGGGYNYSLTVTNAAGTTTLQTVSGRKTLPGQINQFQVFDSNAGSNMYFNNIAVSGSPVVATPAPASFGLVLAGGIGLAGLAIRRRASVARP